jgi:hypothetical protein
MLIPVEMRLRCCLVNIANGNVDGITVRMLPVIETVDCKLAMYQVKTTSFAKTSAKHDTCANHSKKVV